MGKKAIEAPRISGYAMNPSDLTIIGLDTEHKEGEHTLWDERAFLPLKEPMVLNIMAIGVQEPALVTKDGDTILVIDGRQRVLHAREANKRLVAAGEEPLLVPVMLKQGSDEVLEGFAISLNEHRRQDDYMTKVDKCMRMLGRNPDHAKAAIFFGVDVQTIKNWEKLAGVSAKVRKAIDAGTLAPTAAVKLADLSKSDQDEALDKLIAEGGATVATATRTVRQNKRNKKNGNTDDEVLLPPGKRIVKKVIEFYAEAELDEQFIRGVRWAIGDLNPTTIKGLQGLINDIEAKKAKEKSKTK